MHQLVFHVVLLALMSRNPQHMGARIAGSRAALSFRVVSGRPGPCAALKEAARSLFVCCCASEEQALTTGQSRHRVSQALTTTTRLFEDTKQGVCRL